MKIKKARPVHKSKTIAAINTSDRIQVAMIAIGALSAGLWVIIPSDIQLAIQGKAAPILSAMLVGAGVASRIYNGMAKDGRIDVGDLFTASGEFGPDKGDVLGHVLLDRMELARLDEVKDYVEHGIGLSTDQESALPEAMRVLMEKSPVHNPDEVI